MKKFLIGILIVIIVGIIAVAIYFFSHSQKKAVDFSVDPIINTPSTTEKAITPLTDGRQCYTYSHEATPDAPYTTSEFIDMTISGTKVTGTKHGTQSGPDMTNGYEGTLVGDLGENGMKINVAFAYTVEGSQNIEHEIYQAGLTGIDKLRYPLIDKFRDGLFPDTNKAYTLMHYTRVRCEGSH